MNKIIGVFFYLILGIYLQNQLHATLRRGPPTTYWFVIYHF